MVVTDEQEIVHDIVEKPEVPPSRLVATGPAVVDGRIFNYPARQHPSGEYFLSDSIAQMVKDHEMKAVEATFWLPIGYPHDVARAEEYLRVQTAAI